MSYNFVSYNKADKKFNLKKITIVCHSFKYDSVSWKKKKKPASSAHNSITQALFLGKENHHSVFGSIDAL